MSLDTRSTRQSDVLLIEDSEHDAELALRVLQRHEFARSVAESFGDGANSYVVKPGNFDEFSEAVRQIAEYGLTVNVTAGKR